jgi:hypothetical protein
VRRRLVGIVCIAAFAGCGGSSSPRRAEPTPRPAKAAPVLVYLLSSTGADPLGLEVTVTREGRVTALRDAGRAGGTRRERQLSPAALRRLRRLVARTSLSRADRSTTPTPGGSSYILRIGHHTVVFSTGHMARGVQPLLAALLRLRDGLLGSWVVEPDLRGRRGGR